MALAATDGYPAARSGSSRGRRPQVGEVMSQLKLARICLVISIAVLYASLLSALFHFTVVSEQMIRALI